MQILADYWVLLLFNPLESFSLIILLLEFSKAPGAGYTDGKMMIIY